MKTTLERVQLLIEDLLGLDPEAATPQAALVDDLGADSLDFIELIMAIEDDFKLDISDADAEKIRTVQDVVDYIEKHAKAAK